MDGKRLASWPYSSIPPGVARMVFDKSGSLVVCGQQGNVIDVFQPTELRGEVVSQRSFLQVDKSELVKPEFKDLVRQPKVTHSDDRCTDMMLDRTMVVYKDDLPVQTFYRQISACPCPTTRESRRLASVTLHGHVSIHHPQGRNPTWEKSCSVSAALLAYINSNGHRLPDNSVCNYRPKTIVKSVGEYTSSGSTLPTAAAEYARRQLMCTEGLDWHGNDVDLRCRRQASAPTAATAATAATTATAATAANAAQSSPCPVPAAVQSSTARPAILITLQRTGHLLFWHIQNDPDREKGASVPVLLFCYRLDHDRPSALLCLAPVAGHGRINCIVSYSNGKVQQLTCQLQDSEDGWRISAVDTAWLWQDEDGMPPSRLTCFNRSGREVLMMAKHAIICVLSLRTDYELVQREFDDWFIIHHPYGAVIDLSASGDGSVIIVTGMANVSEMTMPASWTRQSGSTGQDEAMEGDEEETRFEDLNVPKFELAYYVSSLVSPNGLALFTATSDSTFVTTRAFPYANIINLDCLGSLDRVINVIEGWMQGDNGRYASWDVRTILHHHMSRVNRLNWPDTISKALTNSDVSAKSTEYLRTVVWLKYIVQRLDSDLPAEWLVAPRLSCVTLTQRHILSLTQDTSSASGSARGGADTCTTTLLFKLMAADWLLIYSHEDPSSLEIAVKLYTLANDEVSLHICGQVKAGELTSEYVAALLPTRQTCPICEKGVRCNEQGAITACGDNHEWNCCFYCLSLIDCWSEDGRLGCSHCAGQYCCGVNAGGTCIRCGGDVY